MEKVNLSAPSKRLFQFICISSFLGQIFPSRVGIDLVKGYYLSKDSKDLQKTSLSIVIDRLYGILALIILNVVAIISIYKIAPSYILNIAIGINAILFLFSILILHNNIFGNWKLFKKINEIQFFGITVKSFSEKIQKLKGDLRFSFKMILLSLCINIIYILINYLLALSIGIKTSLFFFFIFIPLTMTVTILPITLNGLGLREYLIIFFFQNAGLQLEQAFVLALLFRITSFVLVFLGFIFYFSLRPLNTTNPGAHDA